MCLANNLKTNVDIFSSLTGKCFGEKKFFVFANILSVLWIVYVSSKWNDYILVFYMSEAMQLGLTINTYSKCPNIKQQLFVKKSTRDKH